MPYPFKLPELGYSYDALEPHIDARTMEIHHQKHHATYTSKLNAALEAHSDLHGREARDLLQDLARLPEAVRNAVRNNGGGYVNHNMFWNWLKPGGMKQPDGDLGRAIDGSFGSYESFKERFTEAALGQFGSGWAWLAVDASGKLQVMSTPNQDSPISQAMAPILGLDVWEHAYYLKYQNRRPDYVAAFWNVVNWDEVAALYQKAG